MENYQLIYERLHPETKDSSFMTVLEDFIHSVEDMERAVLFPTLLFDLSLDSIGPNFSSTELFFRREIGTRGFYSMVKSLKTQLAQGRMYIGENEEQNLQVTSKIVDLCANLRPLIRQARFIGNTGQEIALSGKPLNFEQEAEQPQCPLIATLQEFFREVKNMESEILFPCLLTSYKAADLECRDFSGALGGNEEDSLRDVYDRLLQLRQTLLTSQSSHPQASSEFHQSLEELKSIFCCYTSMVNKLVEVYQDEVHENF